MIFAGILLAVAVTAAVTWAITKSADGRFKSNASTESCAQVVVEEDTQAAYRMKVDRVKLNSNLPSTPSAGVSDKLQAIKDSLQETREAKGRGIISERTRRAPGETYSIREAFVGKETPEYNAEMFYFNKSPYHD